MSHTKEPWISVTGGRFNPEIIITTQDRIDNHKGEICGMDVEFTGTHGEEQKANTNRIVTCVNACAGISTDSLEQEGSAVMGWQRTARKLIDVTKQRDELLSKVAAWEQKAANWMASPEAAQRLDGYRDIAQRLNVAAQQRDELLAALKKYGCTCVTCSSGISAAIASVK